MLQLLRHQTKPIMITLAVIIIAAFTFWGGYTTGDHTPTDSVMTIAGEDYTLTDVQRLQRTFQIAAQLQLPGQNGPYVYEMLDLKRSYADRNSGYPLRVEGAPVDYATNLVIIRNALEKNGIRASDDEVQQVFRGLGQFQVNGQFDRDLALRFENSLSDSGLHLADVYEVIRDAVGLQKLQKIVAGNLVVSPKAAAEFYASGAQTIKAATIPFLLEDFKKTAKVTDEEVSKYFEENKDKFQSLEKRAVSHVLIAKPSTEGKNAEDTVKMDKEYVDKLIKIAGALAEPKADFDAVVKSNGFEAKTVPAFSGDAPPEEFKEEYGLLRSIFLNDPAARPISDPVEVKKGHEIFKVTSIVKPAQQELKDVKDKIRDTLLAQKGSEAMQKAANDAKKKLEEAIKAGKKLDVAAKEAGVTPKELPEFPASRPPEDMADGAQIAREAMDTAPGSFTKPISTENGIVLVHVISKELRKGPEAATAKKNMAKMLEEQTQSDIFHAWFERRYEEAGIKADRLLQIAMSAR